MPKVRALTEQQRFDQRDDHIVDQCLLLVERNKIKQKEIAEYCRVSVQAISQQFCKRHLSIDTVAAILLLSKASDEEIAKVMRI